MGWERFRWIRLPFLGVSNIPIFRGKLPCCSTSSRLVVPPRAEKAALGWTDVAGVHPTDRFLVGRVALDLGAFVDRSEVVGVGFGGGVWGKGNGLGLVFMVVLVVYMYIYIHTFLFE